MGTLDRSSLKMDTEKFFLRWNEFEENIRQSFKVLRDEKKLFDVTLATDDGYQLQAHRVILSAGSNFFSDIFGKCSQTNMLVYLKGVRRSELENITNFLYNGETSVAQNDLNAFLETAQELKLKGLQNEDISKDNNNSSESKIESKKDHTNVDNTVVYSDVKNYSLTQGKEAIATVEEPYTLYANNLDLENQLEELIEKSGVNWKCRICGKTSNKKQIIKRHSEIHVEGIIHTCIVCKKPFSTKNALTTHMINIHSKLYSCEVCGMRDTNKMKVNNHKCWCPQVQL